MSAEEENTAHGHGHDHPHDHDHGHDHDHDHDHKAPPLKIGPTPQYGFWKSLAELEGKAPLQLNPSLKEFPEGHDGDKQDLLSRRNFFHLMGASMALAGVGAAGCRYEAEEIVPLARRPEDQTPGQTLEYATSYDLAGVGHALIATSYEGRPIHLDGNTEHPYASGGIVPGTERHAGCHVFAQASILHLYDPDRSQSPLNAGNGASLDSFKAALGDLKTKLAAGGARVLTEANASPTVAWLRRRLTAQFPNLLWHEYEPLSWDNERDGTKLAFGRPLRPLARLDQAATIVALDADIFVEHPASMRYSRDYARSRRANASSLGAGQMNRLWAVESTYTNTGAMADHRLPLRSELVLPFVMALDAALSGGAQPGAEFLKEGKISKYLGVLANELRTNHGKAVLIAGRRQPAHVHALVAKINAAIGAPLDYFEDPDPTRLGHAASIAALKADIATNKVQTLLMLGGNPVYDAPVDLDFAGLLAKVQTSIHLSEYQNETSLKATWHVPRAHFLEAWGDTRTWDGTITLAQPLIAPMYGGISTIELLAMLLGDDTPADKLIAAALADATVPITGTPDWRKLVHDGFAPNTAYTPAANLTPVAFEPAALSPSQVSGSRRKNGELEVVFHYSSNTYDGRFANNAWMWEIPDFLTKVTWDNYALVSPETATTLGLDNDTMITIKIGDRSIELPCYTMPGQARYSIGLVLGGGRTAAGHVGGRAGKKSVGYNTYKVRASTGWDIATGATATGGGDHYELANVQDHWDYRPGILKNIGADGIAERLPEMIRETTNDELVKDKSWKAEEDDGEYFWDTNNDGKTGKPRGYSLFEEHTYDGHRWAMAIDLNTCTGCNACTIACQSENNVPVVGRNEVINNREMSWMRIDRYFSGPPDEARVVHQPIGCQQCENAPCEAVCPVGATQHSDEGLNDMAYNRCIGTRYCANNCPYKVRRFNFLDWNKEFREARNKVRRLIFNPDVTVRMRGVMEKCTFCVQRIQNAKIRAKAEHRSGQPLGNHFAPLVDGTVVTACQAACPTESIVFGDLSIPDSRVSKLHADRRTYTLLPEMYTKPRNKFLTRVHNPNPQLASAAPTDTPTLPQGAQGAE